MNTIPCIMPCMYNYELRTLVMMVHGQGTMRNGHTKFQLYECPLHGHKAWIHHQLFSVDEYGPRKRFVVGTKE